MNLVHSPSSISVDSLELESKSKIQPKKSEEKVDTILVPFYENDVLMKVPREEKKKSKLTERNINVKPKPLIEANYLINKKVTKRQSYLERFRKQFTTKPENAKKVDENEISSIMPECGDTERDSFIDDEEHSPDREYFNTEAYNEAFYDKLIYEETNNVLNNSMEERLKFSENICETLDNINNVENNLRSVSEVSQPTRQSRKSNAKHMPNVQLGGLGPDVEKIRPRLERAKSLQRYSEKVRMENRLKIYKQSIINDAEKKNEGSSVTTRRLKVEKKTSNNPRPPSFLVNKAHEQGGVNKSNIIQVIEKKVKSASARSKEITREKQTKVSKKSDAVQKPKSIKKDDKDDSTVREYGYFKVSSSSNKQGIDTEVKTHCEMPPVHINLSVNVGRPSSALKNLEEKHRMYQERIKTFKGEDV